MPTPNDGDTYTTILSKLFGYLSPSDQNAASVITGQSPTGASEPGEITSLIRSNYLSKERATQALGALAGLTPSDSSGGYDLLKNALGLLQQFGGSGGTGMSRENYLKFSEQLNNLLAEAQSIQQQEYTNLQNWNNDRQASGEDLIPYPEYNALNYAELARMFLNPSFSAGYLMPFRKVGNQLVFGTPDKKLFT